MSRRPGTGHLGQFLEAPLQAVCAAQQPSFMPLLTACRHLFGIELQPEHVWELDSSQPNKFSRHIVVCLPKAAFACSATVGAFVAQLLARHEVSSGKVALAQIVLACHICSRCVGMSTVYQGGWLLYAGLDCLSCLA